MVRTPRGITPPAPGLDHEEPELRREEDIPVEDGPSARRGHMDRPSSPSSDRDGRHKPERE